MTVAGCGNTLEMIPASRRTVIRISSYSLTRLVSTSGGGTLEFDKSALL